MNKASLKILSILSKNPNSKLQLLINDMRQLVCYNIIYLQYVNLMKDNIKLTIGIKHFGSLFSVHFNSFVILSAERMFINLR